MKSVAIILSIFLSTLSFAQTEQTSFDMSKYLKDCGGEVYSKCDSDELNQKTIYQDAQKIAMESGKKLMVVIGADWCPACLHFDKMIKEDPSRAKLFENVVMVKLNGDLTSTKTLAQEIQIFYRAYPHAFILEPNTNETLKVFFPSSFKTVESLVKHIDLKPTALAQAKIAKPIVIGTLETKVLELPIERHDDYGVSKFYVSPKTKAEEFVNQGVAAFHVFHYLDAYRAFSMAIKEDPNLVTSYVGQIFSILNLGSSKETEYFLQQAVNKIFEIKKTQKLSEKDLAWAEFGLSFYLFSLESYSKADGLNIKSIGDAFKDLQIFDKDNIDGHALAGWILISILNNPEDYFQKLALADPTLGGPHHYLTHIAENKNNMPMARDHALKLIQIASGSAHAQHMYGHTLPQKGDWKGALNYFMIADQIHRNWAKKYNVDLSQDWHYGHNLDLSAAAYLGLQEFDKAYSIWLMAAQYDSRAIAHVIELSVAIDHKDTKELLDYYTSLGPEWKAYIAPYFIEFNFEAKDLTPQNLGVSPTRPFEELVYKMKESYLNKMADTSALSKEITDYLAYRFTKGGFDGWSNGYIELLRIKRYAKKLSLDKIVEDLEPLEFTVQSGSLCSGNSDGRSLTKCRDLED